MILNSLLCYKSVILYQLSYEVNFRKNQKYAFYIIYVQKTNTSQPLSDLNRPVFPE